MKELELLKKDWQQNNHEDKQVSENQIYDMLHIRSSSVVKWILIVGIIEFVFWFILAMLTDDDNADFERVGLLKYLPIFDAITYFNYVVIFIFIYLSYKNYRSISTLSDTKTLMKSILSVRKTVNGYVAYNLAMIGILFFWVSVLRLLNMPTLNNIRAEILDGTHTLQIVVVLGILLLVAGLIVLLFWIFYKILYGILLKKLIVNYQELKKIDL